MVAVSHSATTQCRFSRNICFRFYRHSHLSHWDISNWFYSNDRFHWLYHFIIFDSFYKKVLKLPNFFHSNSWSEHKLHEWLQKVATRGRFKPKTTKNRIKTVIFPLSRRVQGRDGCQNFINLSQNSYLMVWCSTIQSRRS